MLARKLSRISVKTGSVILAFVSRINKQYKNSTRVEKEKVYVQMIKNVLF